MSAKCPYCGSEDRSGEKTAIISPTGGFMRYFLCLKCDKPYKSSSHPMSEHEQALILLNPTD